MKIAASESTVYRFDCHKRTSSFSSSVEIERGRPHLMPRITAAVWSAIIMKTSIANYFSQKRSIEKFDQLIIRGADPEEFRPLLDLIFIGHRLDGHTLSCSQIFRSRPYQKGRLFEHTEELKYPPSAVISSMGRFNNIGQSIFYGSTSELGTLIEARTELNHLVVISKIVNTRNDQLLFIPLGLESKDYATQPNDTPIKDKNSADRLITRFLCKEITRPVSDLASYNGSVAIGNHFFRPSLVHINSVGAKVPYMGSAHLGLIYPSIHGKKVSNVPTYNLAMLPHTFDENYRIVEADVYSLTLNLTKTELVLTSHNTGLVDASGKIDWVHSYQEMKKRTEQGIFGLDIYEERIKVIAALL